VKSDSHERTAIWALTPNGVRLARRIADGMDGGTLFLPATVAPSTNGAVGFDRLKDEVGKQFSGFPRHVFIMAAGIVVRCIAAHLVHKTRDPAVVVCDEAGRFAISLVSGHMGGANALSRTVSGITGGQPVITTATDVNRVPAIDLIAVESRLTIDNPEAIKTVNMALVTGEPIAVHDPYGKVIPQLPPDQVAPWSAGEAAQGRAAIFVDHVRLDPPPRALILRPASLVAGMGCNRDTDVGEMRELLEETFAANGLALSCLRAVATVDLKADEPGLLALAETLHVPLMTFDRDRLKAVERVPTPSAEVEKHIGVKSVCEAAALLATHRGRLIVPKQKTANVTLAVAADDYSSSASAPADRNT
jgi:cobalt-precorrin 5A hydrolase